MTNTSLCGKLFRTTYEAFQDDMKNRKGYEWTTPKQSLAMARNIARELKRDAEENEEETHISILQGPGDMIGVKNSLTNIVVEYGSNKLYEPRGLQKGNGETYSVISPNTTSSEVTASFLAQPKNELYDEERHKHVLVTIQPKKRRYSLIGRGVESVIRDKSCYKTIGYQTPNGRKEVPMFYVAEKDILRRS